MHMSYHFTVLTTGKPHEQNIYVQICKKSTVEFWNKLVWTGEINLNLYQSDGKRKKGTAHYSQQTTSSVKHGGGSVMAWACMA